MILIILTVTCIAVGLWIYRGVMNPIRELQTAAQNIRDGNLNYSVSGRGVREINDLCDDFEEMRIRLKESAEEKISSDSKSKELISNISHDLKTPVTTIKGYAEGIIDGVAATPEKQKKYIRTIYNKAVEIERLIDELTTYSKIEANRIPYNFQKIHVRDYFIDCIDELNLELESQNIQLNYVNYLTGEPLIIADPEQMRRVINNIVGNSVKYMDKPAGIINIRLRDVDEFIQIEIEDNGKGIAQKDISRVFDRFYRSDTARTSRGGSGIGLSIVKKIVEDHEGKVWATSREGVGTVIYFVLRKYQEVENEQNTDH
jgi:signal transduction histidine kinase